MHDVDAGRLVLAMPFERQAAGEAEAARPGMRRHDPDDGAPRPLAAAREEGFGVIEEGRHGRGQDGVVRARATSACLPAGWRRCAAACASGARRARMVGDGSIAVHGSARILQRRAELAAAGADIEQAADLGHRRRTCGASARDIVGRIDRRGIELERIDVALRQDRHREKQTRQTRGDVDRHREPVAARAAALPRTTGQFLHQDTPPNAFARDRG